MARKAEFGPIIYDAVEAREEGVTKQDAFKEIAANKEKYGLHKMTGNHGSVAASYYRVARSKSGAGKSNADRDGDRDAAASAPVPPLNPARPGVKVDTTAPEVLAQELATQIQDAIRNAVAPLIAERDEAVTERDQAIARLNQIQAALGQ